MNKVIACNAFKDANLVIQNKIVYNVKKDKRYYSMVYAIITVTVIKHSIKDTAFQTKFIHL